MIILSYFIEDLICKIKNNKLKISTMESCTGGMICDKITNVVGCSDVLIGGYVTYSNEQKVRCGVPLSIIENYGVYSSECSKYMAMACKIRTGSDISIGVTGSLGNIDENNKDSKLGEIYFTIQIKDKFYQHHIIFSEHELLQCRTEQKEIVVNKIFNILNTCIDDFLEDDSVGK